jgi:hypothetical protein
MRKAGGTRQAYLQSPIPEVLLAKQDDDSVGRQLLAARLDAGVLDIFGQLHEHERLIGRGRRKALHLLDGLVAGLLRQIQCQHALAIQLLPAGLSMLSLKICDTSAIPLHQSSQPSQVIGSPNCPLTKAPARRDL